MGIKPPKGAVILFGGSSADGWNNGKVVDRLLAATGTTSENTFKDCEIHLEFRTPYKPHASGQERGNSGVYYGGRWETQVLDSFGLEGRMNECKTTATPCSSATSGSCRSEPIATAGRASCRP